MNVTPSLLRRGLLAAVFCLLTAFVRADTDAATDDSLGTLFATVPVPTGVSAEAVQGAIVTTLTGRQWAVRSKSDDRVVGYLRHRSHEAKVSLVYSTAKVEIHCVGWKIDKKTYARLKPELPKGWLENIQSDLTGNLNTALLPK
jgi:hypothetical protein